MRSFITVSSLAACFLLFSTNGYASEFKVLTNHLGYDPTGPKHAVILGKASDSVSSCALKDYRSDQAVLTVPTQAAGPIEKWRDWYFWTVDFDSFTTEGEYYLDCASNQGAIRSFPFHVQQLILERNTLSERHLLFQR